MGRGGERSRPGSGTAPGADERLAPADWVLALAAFAVALAVYANSLGNGFVLDDTRLVAANPAIRSLAGVPALFVSDYWEPGFRGGLYRPVVVSTYALNHALGGLDPLGYHLVNVILHALVSAGAVVLARLLGLARLGAGVAGLGFAALAIHAEAVANVAGRAELLSGLGVVLALSTHVARSRAPSGSRSRRRLLVAGLTGYAVALLSKESAISLLPVLVLYDATLRDGATGSLLASLRRALRGGVGREYLAYAAVTLAYVALRWLALRDGVLFPPVPPSDNPLVALPPALRALNALVVAWRYVGLIAVPGKLSYDYSADQLPLAASLADPTALVAVLATLGLGVLAYLSWYRSRTAFFALGFYVLTFGVVSNLIVPIGTVLGERLVYLPSLGLCLAAGLLVSRATGADAARSQRAGVFRCAVVLVVAFGWVGANAARAVVRSADWRSERTLYLNDLEAEPRSYKKMNNAGWILIDEEVDVPRGVALLERAVAAQPDQFEYLDTLGWGYYKLGRLEEARAALRRSLELEPADATAPIRRAHLRAVEARLRAIESSPGGRTDPR